MRYGVISDVHANLHALQSALAMLERQGVDGVVCAGDLVGYGPQPNECVRRLAELDPICVAGNHDLIAAGRLSLDTCGRLARQTLEWTRDVLTDDTRSYLDRLPLTTESPNGVVVAHGTLDDPSEYTLTPEQGVEQLSMMSARYDASLLLLGHTHRPWAVDDNARALSVRRNRTISLMRRNAILLNPGSVGQARERRALTRFMVLDLEQRNATFYAMTYDDRACRQELVRMGLPSDACHRRPSLLRPLKKLVKKVRMS